MSEFQNPTGPTPRMGGTGITMANSVGKQGFGSFAASGKKRTATGTLKRVKAYKALGLGKMRRGM